MEHAESLEVTCRMACVPISKSLRYLQLVEMQLRVPVCNHITPCMHVCWLQKDLGV